MFLKHEIVSQRFYVREPAASTGFTSNFVVFCTNFDEFPKLVLTILCLLCIVLLMTDLALPQTRTEDTMPKMRHGAIYYSVSELAEKIGVHRNNVIYWINTDKIKAVRLGLAKKKPVLHPS
jgi:hypothetical protein